MTDSVVAYPLNTALGPGGNQRLGTRRDQALKVGDTEGSRALHQGQNLALNNSLAAAIGADGQVALIARVTAYR